jgi:hypothetical protein
MKTLKTLILASVITAQLYAQQPKPIYTANLDFYTGTWLYENTKTGEEFILKLRKVSEVTQGYPHESIVGVYTYKINGYIVTNCMDKFDSTQIRPVSMPVYVTNASWFQHAPDPNKLRMFVTDFNKLAINGHHKRTLSNELLLVSSGTPNQIHWILKNDSGEIFADEATPIEFSIPTDIILTRQSPQPTPQPLLRVDTSFCRSDFILSVPDYIDCPDVYVVVESATSISGVFGNYFGLAFNYASFWVPRYYVTDAGHQFYRFVITCQGDTVTSTIAHVVLPPLPELKFLFINNFDAYLTCDDLLQCSYPLNQMNISVQGASSPSGPFVNVTYSIVGNTYFVVPSPFRLYYRLVIQLPPGETINSTVVRVY